MAQNRNINIFVLPYIPYTDTCMHAYIYHTRCGCTCVCCECLCVYVRVVVVRLNALSRVFITQAAGYTHETRSESATTASKWARVMACVCVCVCYMLRNCVTASTQNERVLEIETRTHARFAYRIAYMVHMHKGYAAMFYCVRTRIQFKCVYACAVGSDVYVCDHSHVYACVCVCVRVSHVSAN